MFTVSALLYFQRYNMNQLKKKYRQSIIEQTFDVHSCIDTVLQSTMSAVSRRVIVIRDLRQGAAIGRPTHAAAVKKRL